MKKKNLIPVQLDYSLRLVTTAAILSRLCILALALISSLMVPEFDLSGRLLLLKEQPKSLIDRLLKQVLLVFVRWDALYFVDIAKNGYSYEQFHAFFPLLPILTRSTAYLLKGLLYPYFEYTTLVSLAGILVSNVTFVYAARWLYKLSLAVSGNNSKFALISSILFCIQPAGIFMSSIYTESLFACLSFWGMLEYHKNRHLMAALLFGLASFTRSNAIVYAGFFIYRMIKTREYVKHIIPTVIYCLITASGFVAFQLYTYELYCFESKSRPWCSNQLPFSYSFIQLEYWNNGFLRYYTPNNIPNFLLALPMICLSVYGLYEYFKCNSIFAVFQLKDKEKVGNTNGKHMAYLHPDLYPYMVLWVVLLIYAIFMMHIQVITRFFSSVPCVFWFSSHVMMTQSGKYAKILLSYFIGYSSIVAILFSAFYPPA